MVDILGLATRIGATLLPILLPGGPSLRYFTQASGTAEAHGSESEAASGSTAEQSERSPASLLDPAQLFEDVLAAVKDNLKQVAVDNLLTYIPFFLTHVAVACSLLHAAKSGLRQAVAKRRQRLKKTVDFLTHVTFPTGFFGPVLGITMGILQLTGKVPTLRSTLRVLLRRGKNKKGRDKRSDGSSSTDTGFLDIDVPSVPEIITAVLETTGAASGLMPSLPSL